MARHTLVKDGGEPSPGGNTSMPSGTAHHIRPGREKSSPEPRVVDPAVVGRRDPALDPPDRVGDVEVGAGHASMVPSARSCIHARKSRLSHDRPSGVRVEVGHCAVDVRAGAGRRAETAITRSDPLQFVPAPGVGLIEVDLRAKE